MFDRQGFLHDLKRFVGFKTVVCQNPDEFHKANTWIRDFFDPAKTEFVEFDCHGLTSTIIKPKRSERPNILGDGHIEVVPAPDEMFELKEVEGILIGRGVADMKTQCLMMIYVLKRLIDDGNHNDFWLVLSEDEEVGSTYGVAIVADYLQEKGLMPRVVFAPDGGPNFGYVEKEKGTSKFSVVMRGKAAHGSRPYLGVNAINRMMVFYERLRAMFPNPRCEQDWVASLSMTKISAGEASNKIPDRCTATFDLRLTEKESTEEVAAQLTSLAEDFDAEIELGQLDPATHYPKEAPIAQKFIEILRRVSGKEPQILHSAGASNGRIYVAKDKNVHVLMSSPTMGAAHGADECLDASSLDAYYDLVYSTACLTVD